MPILTQTRKIIGIIIFLLTYMVFSVLYIIGGAWSMNFITNYFGKDMYWILDAILGVLFGWLTILCAFILWLIQ